MAKATTKKFFMTPVGEVGSYPYIQKPDYGTEKFPKPRGQYLIRLRVPSEKAQGLVDMLTKQADALYERYENEEFPQKLAAAKQAGKRPPKKLDQCQLPFFETDGGHVEFTFKSHASYKDVKTNEIKPLTLRVYDSKGKRIFDVPAVNRGSEGRVEFSVTEFISEVAGVGVSLQLSKFQLLVLKEWSGDDTFGGEDLSGEYGDSGFVADQFGSGASEPSYEGGDGEPSGDGEESYRNVDF